MTAPVISISVARNDVRGVVATVVQLCDLLREVSVRVVSVIDGVDSVRNPVAPVISRDHRLENMRPIIVSILIFVARLQLAVMDRKGFGRNQDQITALIVTEGRRVTFVNDAISVEVKFHYNSGRVFAVIAV